MYSLKVCGVLNGSAMSRHFLYLFKKLSACLPISCIPKINGTVLLLRATREARNRDLRVVITHASHASSNRTGTSVDDGKARGKD